MIVVQCGWLLDMRSDLRREIAVDACASTATDAAKTIEAVVAPPGSSSA